MITHFLGHKFTKRIGESFKDIDFCFVCIECGLYVYVNQDDDLDSFYIFINKDNQVNKFEKIKLNISCHEVFVKKLLE